MRRDVCANNLAGESGSWSPQNRAQSKTEVLSTLGFFFSFLNSSSLHPGLAHTWCSMTSKCEHAQSIEAVCREREAVQVQGLKGEVSPWPSGVLGMLLGELQMTASSSTRARWGGESPKRHSNSSSLVMLGRGLTDRRTCRRRTAQTRMFTWAWVPGNTWFPCLSKLPASSCVRRATPGPAQPSLTACHLSHTPLLGPAGSCSVEKRQ